MENKGKIIDVGGRPTAYKVEFNDLAFKFCLLGATDAKLAEYFEVDERTINRWKKTKDGFCQSIRNGKHVADAEIASSLYNRAKGYSHDDVHISNYAGHITQTPVTKHYPPDTAAAFIWLKNRAGWTDRSSIDSNIKIENDKYTDKELENLVSQVET